MLYSSQANNLKITVLQAVLFQNYYRSAKFKQNRSENVTEVINAIQKSVHNWICWLFVCDLAESDT